MNLEKAAQALVECGYASRYLPDTAPALDGVATYSNSFYLAVAGGWQRVNPINNEAQRQALLEWFKVDVNYDSELETWIAESNREWEDAPEHKTRIEAENACLKEILK